MDQATLTDSGPTCIFTNVICLVFVGQSALKRHNTFSQHYSLKPLPASIMYIMPI